MRPKPFIPEPLTDDDRTLIRKEIETTREPLPAKGPSQGTKMDLAKPAKFLYFLKRILSVEDTNRRPEA